MGTKNNPGKFDCYTNAEPDEPMFVLLARDQMAAFLVSIWSKVRQGDVEAASVVFMKMLNTIGPRYMQEPDVAKAQEAIECSLAMFEWRADNPPMKSLEEIRRTPVGLLTEDEISQLDPEGQAFARTFLARRAKEAACPGHERISTATREQENRGNHRGECKHCGKDMSWDSSD